MIQPDGPECFYHGIRGDPARGISTIRWRLSEGMSRVWARLSSGIGGAVGDNATNCGANAILGTCLLVAGRLGRAVLQTGSRVANRDAFPARDICTALQSVERVDALGEHAADARARVDAAMEPRGADRPVVRRQSVRLRQAGASTCLVNAGDAG